MWLHSHKLRRLATSRTYGGWLGIATSGHRSCTYPRCHRARVIEHVSQNICHSHNAVPSWEGPGTLTTVWGELKGGQKVAFGALLQWNYSSEVLLMLQSFLSCDGENNYLLYRELDTYIRYLLYRELDTVSWVYRELDTVFTVTPCTGGPSKGSFCCTHTASEY